MSGALTAFVGRLAVALVRKKSGGRPIEIGEGCVIGLIAGGITMMLLFQVFVNVGMTVGIMPITGVPAPLLSFGGSSMLVTFLAIGLLQSVHAQGRETAVGKGRATIFH